MTPSETAPAELDRLLDRIDRRHYAEVASIWDIPPGRGPDDKRCRVDGDAWPCDAAVAAAALRLRAAPPVPAADASPLDATWAEVERALPEGWALELRRSYPERADPDRAYWSAARDEDNFTPVIEYGPTPVLALRALARRLTGDPAE